MRSVASLFALASLGPLASGLASAAPSGQVIQPDRMPAVARVDPLFQSYNVEMAEVIGGRFWAPYPAPGETAKPENTLASGGLALEARLFRQREPANQENRRLRSLARALGPAYIRVSGSWANTTWLQDNDNPVPEKPPQGFQNTLTRRQWSGVLAFAKAVGGRLTVSFPASEGARNEDGIWKPDEARKLLRLTRQLGGRIHAAELFNEANLGATSGLPAGYGPATFARDVDAFHRFVREEAPNLRTVGPGSTGETGVPLFSGAGIRTEAMLSAKPNPKFHAFAYHFYGGRSERCARMAPASAILPKDALGEAWLARTDKALAYYKDLRDRFMPGAPIWLNETAQASCGGDRWAASFLDTFRYVDQMGRLARQGVSAVFHNTLAASDYGLIDEATLRPRPNYWAALLWRRLMGEVVLDAGRAPSGVHLYAHCLRGRPGGVALLAINLERDSERHVMLGLASKRYRLTANDLMGYTVQLNGRTLAMAGDALPSVRSVSQPRGAVALPPTSISFFAIPDAGNRACR